MTGEMILDAIGGISDRYLLEFAHVEPKKCAIWWRWLGVAACIGLFLTAVLLWPGYSQSEVDSSKPTFSMNDVIWGDASGDMIMDSFDHVSMGEIFITDGLTEAFARSKNGGDVFAVRVTEVTGASTEEIYEKFIKNLGLEEDYLSRGVIFATQQQVKDISCPEEYGFVFSLAPKTVEYILITDNYLKTTGENIIPVVMYISWRCVPEKELFPDLEKIEAEYRVVMQEIIEDYHISAEKIKSIEPSRKEMHAELDKDTLSKLLKDKRISRMWHEDSIDEGFDLGG